MSGRTGISKAFEQRRFFMHPAHATVGVVGARAMLDVCDPWLLTDEREAEDSDADGPRDVEPEA
jgi:hypothetical protein